MDIYVSSAKLIVSCIQKLMQFKKVIGVGMDAGGMAWLEAFRCVGTETLGVYDPSISKMIPEGNGIKIRAVDFFCQRLRTKIKWDIAISIDFIGRLDPSVVQNYLEDLICMSNVVLFSHSVPRGFPVQRAVYLQSYWQNIFRSKGYICIDCIRPQIWENDNVLLSYKQNLMIYVRESCLSQYPLLMDFYLKHRNIQLKDVVHPRFYLEKVKILQDKVVSLQEANKKLSKRPLKVLYAFYHGASLAWSLVHKLTFHLQDEVYFMVPVDEFLNTWKREDKHYALMEFVNANMLSGVYTYRITAGWNSEIFDTIEKCEEEIVRSFEEDLSRQFCDLTNFDYIYNLTDVWDNIGIYCTIKNIRYTYCETSRGQFALNANENAVRFLNRDKPVYRDVLLKYKTTICQSPVESILTFHETRSVERKDGNVRKFDVEKAVGGIPDYAKHIIEEIFHTKEAPISKNISMILTQGPFDMIEVYNDWEMISKRYQNQRAYTLSTIQFMQDYYVPKDTIPVIKLHPEIHIEKNIERYFDGAYVYHNLYTTVLMKLLPEVCRKPRYIIHNNFTSSRTSFDENTNEIICPGVLRCSMFFHKYYMVLRILCVMNALSLETNEHFKNIGEKGEYGEYNRKKLPVDIDYMIRVQFSVSKESNEEDYIVLQKSPETIEQEASSHDFIIYTDVWETLSIPQLLDISKKFYVGIVKISKKPVKPVEDILVPLQDEYIFFVSKDDSYRTRLESFTAFKENKAMGIELSARMVSMEEYTG